MTAEADDREEHGEEYLQLHAIDASSTSPLQVPLLVNDQLIRMELDTGAAISILSGKQFKDLFPRAVLHEELYSTADLHW